MLRRRRPDPPPVSDPLAGIEPAAAARQIVAQVTTHPVLAPSQGELESIEVVQLATGDLYPGQRVEPAIRMCWRQGTSTFGLLITVRRLAEEAVHLDSAAFRLLVAVDEPHQPAPDGTRTWFLDVP